MPIKAGNNREKKKENQGKEEKIKKRKMTEKSLKMVENDKIGKKNI